MGGCSSKKDITSSNLASQGINHRSSGAGGGNPNREWKLKIGLVGEAYVGKTSSLLRYVDNEFEDDEDKSTVGVDYRMKNVTLRGKDVKLQIVDTAGQERFRTITASFYRGASGVIIMYDVTNRKSFERCADWLSEVRLYTREGTVVLLVGNKMDRSEERKVQTEEAAAWAQKEKILGFFETSAKDGTNIEECFTKLASAVVDHKMSSAG